MALETEILLKTATVTVVDFVCQGDCDELAASPLAHASHLIFPYRGVFVRRDEREDSVGEPNQVLLHNAGTFYQIIHQDGRGHASLAIVIEPEFLAEITPRETAGDPAKIHFQQGRMRIDPRAQALVAMLRYSLRQKLADPLEAETLSLTLVQRALGARTAHRVEASQSQRKLVDRVKLVLTRDLARRWTLSEIASEVGGSPVYLTQVFRNVEAVPLYRYHLRLRLAKALDLIADYRDLTALALDLGFSSHSHFSAAFRQAYGRSPSEFREAVLKT